MVRSSPNWSDLVQSGPNYFKTLKKGKNTDKRQKNDVFGEKIIISINYLLKFIKIHNFLPRQDHFGLDFYVVLSGPIWSNQVQSGLVWSDLVLAIFFHFIWSNLVRLGINFM